MPLCASKLGRLVERVHPEERLPPWDRRELLRVWLVEFLWELDLAGWLESQLPREDRLELLACLVVLRVVGEANGLNLGRGGGELLGERPLRLVVRERDVVPPVVLEEVPAGLSVDGKHGDQVGGVDTVSEELEAHARLKDLGAVGG